MGKWVFQIELRRAEGFHVPRFIVLCHAAFNSHRSGVGPLYSHLVMTRSLFSWATTRLCGYFIPMKRKHSSLGSEIRIGISCKINDWQTISCADLPTLKVTKTFQLSFTVQRRPYHSAFLLSFRSIIQLKAPPFSSMEEIPLVSFPENFPPCQYS